MKTSTDTIAAIATPPGRGGVGIIRVSGKEALRIAERITGKILKPRYATFCDFKNEHNEIIDQGLALYFKAPHSFTGEDVLELQAHGGPIILDQLLKCILQEAGLRHARPGEFSERAYLNNKIDLVQAEAISDLINASTQQAAQAALRSLQGEFSAKIDELLQKLIQLRVFIEAAIDFPEEEIDFIQESRSETELNELLTQVRHIFTSARQGSLLQEGMTAIIVGKPNAGKSSLLNALCGNERAIVTNVAGTTRDVLREQIHLDGLPLHIIDTAGLRDSVDEIEQEGIRRAQLELEKADIVLWVIDATQQEDPQWQNTIPEVFRTAIAKLPTLIIKNKIDLVSEQPHIEQRGTETIIALSAKQKQGLELLSLQLKERVGYQSSGEGNFSARRRHLNALEKTQAQLEKALLQLKTHRAYELVAQDLREAQDSLSEITGSFTSDELLGEIFAHFCIGK